jgi:hypothetical protein
MNASRALLAVFLFAPVKARLVRVDMAVTQGIRICFDVTSIE